jgi:hypothetical protein
MVCFEYINANTLHKGNNKDNDDDDGGDSGLKHSQPSTGRLQNTSVL